MVLSKEDLIYFIVVISTAILIIIFFFVTLIIVNVKKRKQGEIEKLNAIIIAEDNERSRIAKDMHDDLGPLLSGIKLQINLLSKNTTPEELGKILFETSTQLDTAIENIRYIVRNLMPPGLRKYGLIKSILDFHNIISKNNNIIFEFKYEGFEERLQETTELNIFRIIYELINNSLKHSGCSIIILDMKLNKNELKISYKDNGIDITPVSKADGMGLMNIESRVNLFDGKFVKPNDFSKGADYFIEFKTEKLFHGNISKT